MTKVRIGFMAMAVIALTILSTEFAMVTPALAEEDQCVTSCDMYVTNGVMDEYGNFSEQCVRTRTRCETMEQYIINVAKGACGAVCKRRLERNFAARNGRVTITRYGRSLGFTPVNIATFHPPGVTLHTGPAPAGIRGPAGGNKLTQGSKAPIRPLTSQSGATNASLLKKKP